ncbi:hypothetical protein TKK_0017070 [Trichogramma kaykai]
MKDIENQSNKKKSIKLRNHNQKTEVYDILHSKNIEKTQCSNQLCLGSVMSTPPHGTEVRKSNEILEHAKDFLNQYFTSIKRVNSESHKSRWKNIEKEVLSTGSYQLTETELIFGAKLAWRNASRCIGRIQWSKLQGVAFSSMLLAEQTPQKLYWLVQHSSTHPLLRSLVWCSTRS